MSLKISTALGIAALVSAISLSACTAPPKTATDTPATAAASGSAASTEAMSNTLKFVDAGTKAPAGKKVAYLAECAAANAYCQTRQKGAQETAAKMGVQLTVFDANFDPAAQLQQVQDAVQRGFDGYIFSPVADAPGCSDFHLLQASGKPVSTINSPMCGNPDYTPETAGFVGMQTTRFFTEHVENAFKSCTASCNAVAVGGFVGSDLFTRWETAIKTAAAKYPNIKVVSDQPGNFDPAKALSVVQDAISANGKIDLVISSWDDMTRGVEQAVHDAGKIPGKDVRIYSVGGTTAGVAKVTGGAWTSTSVLLPYEESSYGVAQLVRALSSGENTPGFAYLAQAPAVTQGPGSIFITAANASKFHPEY
ncbi:sugar ABC transporter substrate-binding protein [Arthrobacter sp. NPDC058127]|uniref:sugar ABC transporter substrate-binding protein n=1 Tax=Arthrobacter sp. NPDC058127 TaxID=3346351 RepID=UPI0036E78FFB